MLATRMRRISHFRITPLRLLNVERRSLNTRSSPTSTCLQAAEKPTLKLESKPPEHVQCDWIGPADPDSNLRPRQYYIPKDETETERKFRILQEETQRWSHNFWAQHNKNFSVSKGRFIQAELAKLGPILEDGTERRLMPETLSQFYHTYLKDNHEQHKEYNKEWYQRNIALLWPAFKVFCIRRWRMTKRM